MGLRNFERKLEQMVEGAFARAFRTNVRPIELGRRLTREMDDRRTISVDGKTVVPNHFRIALNPADHAELADVAVTLARQLADAAREHARDEEYAFLGPVEVAIEVDPALRTGRFEITCHLKEGPGGLAGALLLPSGERVVLGEDTIAIGRLPDCEIVLPDAEVSRVHAEVRRGVDGYLVIDLDSTNGTKVNNIPVREQRLRDGDEITIGSTVIRFEAS